jgi:hypothetical protein
MDPFEELQRESMLLGGGGNALAQLFNVNPNVAEENYDKALAEHQRCCMYREVFSTPAGTLVLQDLYERNVPVVQFDPRVANPEVMGFFNEGSKSVVLFIRDCIEKAGRKPPQQPESEELDLG